MVSVGTMIGAGYASGQEIAAFFGWNPSLFVPLLCGLLMFFFTAVLLLVGSKLGASSLASVNDKLFGKLKVIVDGVMLFNALVVLSAMMAGMDGALTDAFGRALPYGVFAAGVAVIVLRRGNKGLLAANVAVVPFIIAVIIATCLTSPLTVGEFRLSSIPSCFTYVSMNLLLSAGVLVQQKGMTTKQILLSAAISSVLIASAMAMICLALPAASSVELPVLSLARGSNVAYTLFTLCLAVSIFTTLLSALSTLRSWAAAQGDGTLGMLASVIVAALVSMFGFGGVVNFFYPVIGVIGLLYLVRCALFLFPPAKLFQQRHRAVHTARENAKRDGGGHDEICAEDLPAVYDQITQTGARYKVFAHDRAHPREAHVDLDDGKKRGDRGGEHRVPQQLEL